MSLEEAKKDAKQYQDEPSEEAWNALATGEIEYVEAYRPSQGYMADAEISYYLVKE